jgi:glycosyltransferase involved in cell wall biosynthesis
MHENQLGYPWAEHDRDVTKGREGTYGFVNYTSALAADEVWFNSDFHLESFFAQLPPLLRSFPQSSDQETDRWLLPALDGVKGRSRVMPVGVDLAGLDAHRVPRRPGASPLVLWNHRWEHDKNPAAFFGALAEVAADGFAFEVCVLGQSGAHRPPPEFEAGRAALGGRVVQWGFAADAREYAEWLWRSDILLVTSLQEYFGVSVVEAMHCGCFPLLPRRLAYPGHFPDPGARERQTYTGQRDLQRKLRWALTHPDEARGHGAECAAYVARYRWDAIAPLYDGRLRALLHPPPSHPHDPLAPDNASHTAEARIGS